MSQPKIVVVDDDPRLRQILQLFLSVQGYDVTIAEDGLDGWEKVTTVVPDAAILDVMMPGIDGFELCTRLRANPATANIPIVIYTALSDEDDIERGRTAGADHMLTKPFNLEQFAALLKELVATGRPTPAG